VVLSQQPTAGAALDVRTALLEKHGPGGSPRHNDPKAACYDSSFILADPGEAWVLETSGRDWAARRIQGLYAMSNAPCLSSDYRPEAKPRAARWPERFTEGLGDRGLLK
jgi:secernin